MKPGNLEKCFNLACLFIKKLDKVSLQISTAENSAQDSSFNGIYSLDELRENQAVFLHAACHALHEVILTNCCTKSSDVNLLINSRALLAKVLFQYSTEVDFALELLDKAICIAEKHRMIDQKLRLYLLQVDILLETRASMSQAKSIIKKALKESKALNLHDIVLEFHYRRIKVADIEGDVISAIENALNDLPSSNTFDGERKILYAMQHHAGIKIGQVSMNSIYQSDVSGFVVSHTEEVGLISGLYMNIVMFIEQLVHENYHDLEIIISRIHEIVESSQFSKLSELSMGNSCKLRWMSRKEIFSLIFVLSGISSFSAINQAPPRKFFLEGAKFIEKELSFYENLKNDSDITVPEKLKFLVYSLLIGNLLMKREFSESDQLHEILNHWLNENLQLTNSNGENASSIYSMNMLLMKAGIDQAKGSLGSAIESYEKSLDIVDDDATRVYILVQLVLSYLGQPRSEGNFSSEDRLSSIVSSLESNQPPEDLRKSQQCSKFLALGLNALRNKEYHRTKAHLLEGLKILNEMQAGEETQFVENGQLKSIFLGLLGEVYLVTENAQAEKMLNTAYSVARKMKNDYFCIAVGSMLSDLCMQGDVSSSQMSAKNLNHYQSIKNSGVFEDC